MKVLCVLLCIISTVQVAALEKGKRVTTGSIAIPRTLERDSFDSIFEPKRNAPSCANHCICTQCLEKACCELDKIRSKLPFLELMLKNAKNNTDDKSATEEITAARMMAKIVFLQKESKKLKLISKKSQKKSNKGHKVDNPGANFKQSSDISGRRLTTPGDYSEDEEYNQLTNSSKDNMRWRLAQAGADIL